MIYTAVIIDDEAMGRLVLREKIKSHLSSVEIIGEASDGENGLALITRLKPDLVFLDIELPDMNGFELLDQLEYKDFNLIFITAYDYYAIKAFKYGAIDYLLKPIDITELVLLIDKLDKNQNQKNIEQRKVDFSLVGQYVQLLKKQTSKVAVPDSNGITFIEIDDIIYLNSDSNYTIITTTTGKPIVSSRTLKDFEGMLSDWGFFRCHLSYLVHIKYIRKYIRGDGGQVEMMNGQRIEVSRRRKDELLLLLKNMI